MTDTHAEPELVRELLELSQRLLESIDRQDWTTYTQLCAEDLTAFEPEAAGHLVSGMNFHRFYLDRCEADENARTPPADSAGILQQQSTISSPHVRLLGDVAVICYVRLVQRLSNTGEHITSAFEETRIWQRRAGKWQHVHFHRSPAGRFSSQDKTT